MKLFKSIIVRFISPLILGMGIIAIISISIISKNVPDWVSIIKDSMKDEELRGLRERTTNRARLSEEYFGQIIGDIQLQHDYAHQIFNNELPIKSYYPHHFSIASVDPTLPPGGVDENGKNWKYSVYDSRFSTDPHQLYNNESSVLDNVWRPLVNSNPGYDGLYMGLNTGLYRYFPFRRFETNPSFPYTCASSNQPVVGYDPRCRGWYYQAQIEPNGRFIITEPYIDAFTGKVLITVARAVRVNNLLVGVVAVDISMQRLEDKLISSKVMENGYTYLIDDKGQIVVYPEVDRDIVYNLVDKEFLLDSEKIEFNGILNLMKAGGTGQELFKKDGKDWYITYSPVFGTNYRIGMVVPLSDIERAANDMEDEADKTFTTWTIIFVFTILGAIVIDVGVAYKLTQRVLAPVLELDRVTKEVTKANLDVELKTVAPASAELSMIYEHFQNLMAAIGVGNDHFYNGNLERAYSNYLKVEQMMDTLNNERGKGVVLNNKANVLKQMEQMHDHLNQAKECYEEAINNAKKLGLKAEGDDKDVFKIVLADRYMNMGVFMKEQGNIKEALKYLDMSYQLHRETDNSLGLAKTSGNIGQIYIEQGHVETASGFIENAWAAVKDSGDAITIQYAAMNMGVLREMEGKFDEGAQYFRYALDYSQKIDKYVRINSLDHLANCYQRMGMERDAKIIRDMIGRTTIKSKDVHFVLDASGSMYGSFVQQCRDSIKNIIINYVTDMDNVSLSIFHDRVETIFDLKPKFGNERRMLRDVDSKFQTGGRTAFYDAVHQAVQHANNTKTPNEEWIIALTDGEDNMSRYGPADVIRELKRGTNKIIIITVGKLNSEQDIVSICKAGTKGIHIPVRNGMVGIKEAFNQVAKMITSQVNVEYL